jgi:hypothetical protein
MTAPQVPLLPVILLGLETGAPGGWPDKHGEASVISDGHALEARKCLEGARVELREEFA